MLDRPFDSWRKFFRKHNSETKEFAKYAFEKLDALSNWIIGLSVGAVSLLVSEFTDLNKLLTFGQTKTIFLFLFISVFCGVFYRIFFFIFYYLFNQSFMQVDIALSDDKIMDTEDELTGEETFEKLLALNSQFQDITKVKDIYPKLDKEHQLMMYNDMVSEYMKGIAFAKRDTEIVFEFVSEVYQNSFGVKKDEFDFTKKRKGLARLKLMGGISILLYIGLIASFLFALGYFMVVIKYPVLSK